MGKHFASSGEVFGWISGFINLERGQTPKSFRLDRMEFLTELAGHPQRCAPSIHIAGSKGKGSVTSMLAAMLAAAGFRTARYMSPHVIDIRERICLNDTFFSEDIYCSAGSELKHIIEELLPAAASSSSQALKAGLFDPAAPDGCEPTFWELLTLLFFLCARHAKCDVMVVETGMGGRLDSTNVLDPLVSVITLIELEHTKFLGETITAIAGEKAGIIKTGRPLVLAKQCGEALEVFRKKAEEKNSPLFYFPEIAKLSGINITPIGTEFTLTFNCSQLAVQYSMPIPGKVQAENAALAIAALKIACQNISHKNTGNTEAQGKIIEVNENAIRKGLASLKVPGRFEKIFEQPPFIIDGAHTPESLALCIETFCYLYGVGGVLIFACAADKDERAMAKIACSHFAKIIITTPGTFKVSNPEKVYEAFLRENDHTQAQKHGEKIMLIKDTQEAIRQAVDFAKTSHRDEKRKTLPILGTGSFYLVSEIRGMDLFDS